MARRSWKRLVLWCLAGLLILFALIQAVPYGRKHSDPPVTREPAWNTPETRTLAARACFDCHSNLTKWPWYSNVAPNSWLIQRDVDGGRQQFNFSEWDKPQDVGIGDLVATIRNGSMPPWYYRLLHANARLDSAEKDALVRGLEATFAASPPRGGAR